MAQYCNVKAAIEAIDEAAWQPIAYTRGGEAQVAETTITAGWRARGDPRTLRLVLRRTRLTGAQAELWPNWRHHAFITSRDDLDTKAADAYHRGHATVELAIRDLKENSGLSRCPSGKFFANAAWLSCGDIAHNIARWTARLGGVHPQRQLDRRGHRAPAAPGRARPARQPQPPTQTAPARTLALGAHLHHRPATNRQPAPAHLTHPHQRLRRAHPQRPPTHHQQHRPNPTPAQ